VREENILILENAVRKMGSFLASLLRTKDKGLLVKGYKEDVVIFNPVTVRDTAAYDDSQKYSSGIEYVMVNGKLSIEKGEFTGSLNGKVLLLTENK
jgi:N-acyl-D-aspartate/D-glutamate deacylase